MKRLGDFVSRGLPETFSPEAEGFTEPLQPPSSQLHPADLPRDPGMAGDVGAYEVKALARFLGQSLDALTDKLGGPNGAEAVVSAALDRLMPPAERHGLAVESVASGVIILSLARKSDRFRYARTLIPTLKAAVQPHLGAVRIQLTDRLR